MHVTGCNRHGACARAALVLVSAALLFSELCKLAAPPPNTPGSSNQTAPAAVAITKAATESAMKAASTLLYSIDCGGRRPFIDSKGVRWDSDENALRQRLYSGNPVNPGERVRALEESRWLYQRKEPPRLRQDDSLYRFCRRSLPSSGPVVYAFPVRVKGTYRVVLYFIMELRWEKRWFDIKFEGRLAIKRYSLSHSSGGKRFTTAVELVDVVEDGEATIEIHNRKNVAIICGIQIYSLDASMCQTSMGDLRHEQERLGRPLLHNLGSGLTPELNCSGANAGRGAFAISVTHLKSANFTSEIIRAVHRLREVTSAHILLVLDRETCEDRHVLKLEQQAALAYKNVYIMRMAQPLREEELPLEVASAARRETNCCGFREFLKLNLWNLTTYDRIISLDVDVLLLRSVDHLFAPRCGLDAFDVLYAPGPGSPWNGGFFVAKPSATVYERMLLRLRTARYSAETGWNGFGQESKFCCRPYCNGAATLQGFLYYFFVRSRGGRVAKLSFCHYDFQLGPTWGQLAICQMCANLWNATRYEPYVVHKANPMLLPYFAAASAFNYSALKNHYDRMIAHKVERSNKLRDGRRYSLNHMYNALRGRGKRVGPKGLPKSSCTRRLHSHCDLRALSFLHIPKAAGTSIEELGRGMGVAWGAWKWFVRAGATLGGPQADGLAVWKQSTAREAWEHASALRHANKTIGWSCNPWHIPSVGGGEAVDKNGNLSTFCIVREPASRFVAQFHHKADPLSYCDADAFKAWAVNVLESLQKHGGDMNPSSDCHYIGTHHYMPYCDIALLYDHLEEDLDALLGCYGCNQTGLMMRLPGGSRQQAKRIGSNVAGIDDCARGFAQWLRGEELFSSMYAADMRLHHGMTSLRASGGLANPTRAPAPAPAPPHRDLQVPTEIETCKLAPKGHLKKNHLDINLLRQTLPPSSQQSSKCIAAVSVPAKARTIVDESICRRRFVWVTGWQHSGTSLTNYLIQTIPCLSGLTNTGAPMDEGQHLQGEYPVAREFGGHCEFPQHDEMYMDEHNEKATVKTRVCIFEAWAKYWNLQRSILVEKSPPAIVQLAFREQLFPGVAASIVVVRHPLYPCLASKYHEATQLFDTHRIRFALNSWLRLHQYLQSTLARLHLYEVLMFEKFALEDDPAGHLQVSVQRFFPELLRAGICNSSRRLLFHSGSVAGSTNKHPKVNTSHIWSWANDWELGMREAPTLYDKAENVLRGYEEEINNFGYSLLSVRSLNETVFQRSFGSAFMDPPPH